MTPRLTHRTLVASLSAAVSFAVMTEPASALFVGFIDQVVKQVSEPVRRAVDHVKKDVERKGRTLRRHMDNVRKHVEKTAGRFVKGAMMPAVKGALKTLVDAVAKGGKNAAAAAKAPLQAVKMALGPLGKHFHVQAITKSIRQSGVGFAKDATKCIAAFADLSPGAVGTLVKCMTASVVASLPGIGNFLGFLKEIGFPNQIGSPKVLLEAFTKLGDAGMRGIQTVYKMGLGNIPGIPKLDSIEGLWRAAQKTARTLLGGAKGGGQSLDGGMQKIIEKVMAELALMVPKLIEKFTGFRDGVRKLLTLELKTPWEKNAAVQAEIDRVAGNVIDPLVAIIATTIKKVVPRKLVDDTVALVKKPLLGAWSFIMRGLIFGRSLLKQGARMLLPRIIEGAAGVARWMEKLKIPPMVKNVLLGIFDQMQNFFGGIGSFLLTLVPELRETVIRVLDSVVAASEDVKGALRTLGSASSAKSPQDMLSAMAGIEAAASGDGAQKDSPKARRLDPAAIAAARKAYTRATKEAMRLGIQAEKADNALLEAKARGGSTKAAEGRVAAAREAADKANEAVMAARTALLRVDPDAATERVITTVWERLVEALLKVVWDGGNAVADLFITSLNRAYLLVMQIMVAAMGGIGGVFVVTIDWVPLLAELYGTVCITLSQVMVEASRTIFNSVVLPEIRVLVKDQLVDYGTLFVDLWKNPKKRAQMQTIGRVLNKVFESMGPFAARLAKARDTVKAGAAALYAGPLGAFFKKLPPQLFAAISKAVTKGTELLQKLAIQSAKALGSAIASKGKAGPGERKMTPQEIAKIIIGVVREPLIEYVTSLLPDEPELDDLKRALAGGMGAAADRLAAEPSPVKLLNPAAIIGVIGDGILGAKAALATFLAKKWKVPDLDGVLEGAIGRVGQLFKSGGIKAEVIRVLQSGPLGIIREVFSIGVEGKKSLRDFIVDRLVLRAPADLRAELTESLQKSFDLVLQPGALSTVLKDGIRGIVAKVVELSHKPILKLMLRGFPEGPVTQAVREVLLALGKEASAPNSPLFTKLAQGGIAGVVGIVLEKESVADALAGVLTADLESAGELRSQLAGAIQRTGAKLAEKGLTAQFNKDGLRSLLVDFGKPVAQYLIDRLTRGIGFPAIAGAVKTLLLASLDDLAKSESLADAIRNVPQKMLARLRLYAEKLAERVQQIAAAKAGSLRGTLATLASSVSSAIGTPRMLDEAKAALAQLASDLKDASASLPAVEEVLR
jgi:hypothetical protein